MVQAAEGIAKWGHVHSSNEDHFQLAKLVSVCLPYKER